MKSRRRGDGDRPHVQGGAAEGAALARDRRTRASSRPALPDGAAGDEALWRADRRAAARAGCGRSPRRFRRGVTRRGAVHALRRSTRGSCATSRRSSRREAALARPALARRARRWLRPAKQLGFSDRAARRRSGTTARTRCARCASSTASARSTSASTPAPPSSRRYTPYFYSTYEDEDEARPTRAAEDHDPRRRAEPDRAGHRVRLLLRARRVRAARGRLRDHHGQLQPGDRLDRLRHVATGSTSSR